MDDRQFEDRLRRAFHAEVESMPLNVTADVVLRRSRERQRPSRLAWAAVAAAAGLILAAGILAALGRPSPGLVGGTPTPPGSPNATPSALAINESAGELRVAFTAPAMPEMTVSAVCQWAPAQPLRVDRVESRGSDTLRVLGEELGVLILVDDPIVPDLVVSRTLASGAERASYSPEAGDDFTTDASGDLRSGRMTFTAIDTLADDYPVDALPAPRADFGRPLGDDPSAARISGAISWDCDPAQAAFDPPPAPSPEPTAEPIDLPTMELASFAGTRDGATLCGEAYKDGSGPVGLQRCEAWVSPNDYPEPLPIEPGGELRLGPSPGWGLRSWRVVASTVEEIERTFGDPAVFVVLSEKSGEGTVSDLPATFRAPTAPGDWIMRATVAVRGEGPLEANGTFLFVVRVEGAP